MLIPLLAGIPLYDSQAEARVNFWKEARKKLLHSPRVRGVNQLLDIAGPFAKDIKLFKLLSQKKIINMFLFKLSFTLTVIVPIVSTLLHLHFMFAFHKFQLSERRFPNVVKTYIHKIAVKPHVHVPEEQISALPALEKRLGRRFRLPRHYAATDPKNGHLYVTISH